MHLLHAQFTLGLAYEERQQVQLVRFDVFLNADVKDSLTKHSMKLVSYTQT